MCRACCPGARPDWDSNRVSLWGEYPLPGGLAVFARADNLFAAEYDTFGLLGEADEVLGDGFDDPRFASPGSPFALSIGLSWRTVAR